ncbi:MAG: flagellar biosynthetic protein FliR [Cellvibrionaceae bacterium]
MFEFSDYQITQFVGQYIWPLVRITAFLLAAPIFGTKILSTRIRLVFGVVLSLLVVPLLPPLPPFDGVSFFSLYTTLQQVLIGVSLGFVFQVVFQVFVLAGQYIAMKMGLGFASMNDPANGVSVTVISQFYLLTTTLLFLSINGHLALVQVLVDSFTILPIGTQGFSGVDFDAITKMGGWMFGSALTISLPVLTALLVVNIAFGIMSRSAPQINIFAVGFPITLIFGLLIMWLGFPVFLPLFQEFVNQGFIFGQQLLEP